MTGKPTLILAAAVTGFAAAVTYAPLAASQPQSSPAAQAARSPARLSALTLGQAMAAALKNNDMTIARSSAAAAKADVVAADRAPFPTLSAKLGSIDLQNGIGDGNLLTEKRIDKGIGIDWVWERGDKRKLRTQVAQRSAEAAQRDVEEAQLQQLLAASGAFFDLAAAQERVTQVQAIAESTAQMATAAGKRFNAGDLARQDALRLEIEAERAKGDVSAISLERWRASLALAAVLDLDPHEQTLAVLARWPQSLADTAMNDDALRHQVDARPDVQAAQERLAAAQASIDSVLAQKKSDVTWGLSYDHFPGTSTGLIELRMQVPLQTGYGFQGETARAHAQRTAAEASFNKVRHAAALELQGLRAQVRSAAQRSQSYEQDILPRARKVAEQAEFAYIKGALALNDLLDARRTLRTTGLDALAARTDYAKAVTAWRLRTQPHDILLNELNQGR